MEWVAIPFSRESSQPRDLTHVSYVSCIAGGFFTAEPVHLCNPMDCSLTPWTALLSIEFSRQEYWRGLLFPSPGDLPDPGMKPGFPTQASRFISAYVLPRKHIYVCVCICVYIYFHHYCSERKTRNYSKIKKNNRVPDDLLTPFSHAAFYPL